MKLHIGHCVKYGISFEELQRAEESSACTAYTRYVLDIGQSQDQLGLQIAMASCAIGYMEVGKWLMQRETTVKGEGNPYWTWIQAYTSERYVKFVENLKRYLELEARGIGVGRVEELVEIFAKVTKLEERFWGSALNSGGTGLVQGP
jgi:hydroxymethylpyrimidine/phosphomethylpyrimidine kinase